MDNLSGYISIPPDLQTRFNYFYNCMRCILLLYLFSFGLQIKAQNRSIDSLRQLLASAAPEKKSELLRSMAMEYVYIKPETTIELASEALAAAKKLNNPKEISASFNMIGFGYWGKGNSPQAFEYYHQSLEIAQDIGDEMMVSRNYQNIANIYNQSGYYTKAISMVKSVLPYLEANKANDRLAFAYNSIGYGYLSLRQFDSSVIYLDKAKPLAKAYRPQIYPTILFNYADIAFRKKEYLQSKEHLVISRREALAIGDRRMNSRTNQLMAELKLIEGDADSALLLAKQAVAIADEAGIKESAFPSYLTLARASEAKGNLKDAVKYMHQHLALKDSVRNREVTSAIGLYEYDQQQNQINILKADRKLNRLWLFGAIGLTILLAAFLLYLNAMRRKTLRTNRLLAQKNEEIAQQAKELEELNLVKSKLFSIVAHDLRSPLSGIVGVLQLLQDETITPEEIVPHLPGLSQSVGETLTMLDNLLLWSKSQLQGVIANPEHFHLNQVVASKIKLYEQEALRKGIHLKNQVMADSNVFADKNMIGIVLQNLLNNAVKFTNLGGSVRVSATQRNGRLQISVTDTGRGISAEKINKLINGQGYTTEGTAREKGLGLGFQICKEFVALNKGELFIESIEHAGTTVTLSLPATQE
jgi:two-component system, sensor histidine kinase and response regulator